MDRGAGRREGAGCFPVFYFAFVAAGFIGGPEAVNNSGNIENSY
jgi:hypothetical protein